MKPLTDPRPTEKQLMFQEWEFGAFFHFGIRTFYEGHADWDMKPMPVEGFCPTMLDCGNWISAVKKAGAKYAILVTKHHDGFANWPSAYSHYSVAQTPWKNGKGDVVREFTDACRTFGLKVGLYYSPAEFDSKTAVHTAKEYDDYFVNQISELLGNYGKIDYLWFDGCGSEGHIYDTQRIVGVIRKLQPEIMIFNMWDPDTRWVGNEAGLAPMPNYNTVQSINFSVLQKETDQLDQMCWLPAECDCRIRKDNWFYSDGDVDTLKSVEELMGLYDYSVGRGANMLLNISPDRRGLLPDADRLRLEEFGTALRARFAAPLAAVSSRADDCCVLTMSKENLVNCIVLREDLTQGESVQEFEIQVKPHSFGEFITVYRGCSIGHKAICSFPAVSTSEVHIQITRHNGDYSLTEASIYHN